MDKWTEGEATSPKEKEEKPSRWWMLYHFWAGICLKAYVDVSGLSKIVLGAPGGADPASASGYAGTAAILSVGAVALGYFLSKSLIKIIDGGTMANKGKIILKTILPIAYFAGAIFLAMATAPLFAASDDHQKTASSVPQKSTMKLVKAYTTIQDAEGVTESSLDQAGLKNLETWLVQTMLQKGRNKYAEMGYNPKDFKPEVSANSVYIRAGGKKLAVIKINMDNSSRSVTIMGIKGNELHRVSCIRASNHDIPVWSGECGNKIQETFGVSIKP